MISSSPVPPSGITVALGAGALRGLAHIGVLQVFQQHRIPIKAVTGSSIGAVVGALFGAGIDLKVLAEVAINMRTRQLLDPDFSQPSLFAGQKIKDLLRLFLGHARLEELDFPLGVTATDLVQGKEVVFTRGELVTAVMASLAVPGVFPPVKQGSRVLADGGLLARLPVKAAREIAPHPVVAVSLEPPAVGERFDRTSDIILRSLELVQMELQKARCPRADVLIRPDVASMPAAHLTRARDCIAAGTVAAENNLGKIWELLKK